MNYILSEWLNDIRQNQLQTILGGVGPTYRFVTFINLVLLNFDPPFVCIEGLMIHSSGKTELKTAYECSS